MTNLGSQFTVITQHGAERTVRRKRFKTWDEADAHVKANTPDTDSSMVPTMDDKYLHHPDYESGGHWFGNRYAVITRSGNRKRQ